MHKLCGDVAEELATAASLNSVSHKLVLEKKESKKKPTVCPFIQSANYIRSGFDCFLKPRVFRLEPLVHTH